MVAFLGTSLYKNKYIVKKWKILVKFMEKFGRDFLYVISKINKKFM